MNWKPGDVAIINSRNNRSGQYCILRRLYEDEDGGNDFFFQGKVIPKAWIVDVINQIDCVLVAESVLQSAGHPNEKCEWSDCEWQPIEYLKYP